MSGARTKREFEVLPMKPIVLGVIPPDSEMT